MFYLEKVLELKRQKNNKRQSLNHEKNKVNSWYNSIDRKDKVRIMVIMIKTKDSDSPFS